MKSCIDINVLLETLLESRQHADQAMEAIRQAGTATISSLSVHLYVYFGQRERHSLASLLEDLSAYAVLTMDEQVVRWAVANRQDDDFEDALQVGCAVLEGCKKFITFDQKLAKNYGRFIDMQLLSA